MKYHIVGESFVSNFWLMICVGFTQMLLKKNLEDCQRKCDKKKYWKILKLGGSLWSQIEEGPTDALRRFWLMDGSVYKIDTCKIY